jgi:large subunit ribosomal protein L13
MIIDGSNQVLGRVASNVAKRLLKGERVYIVNAEKIVVTGKKENVLVKFKRRIDLHAKGNPLKAPKFPRTPHGLVRMSIRGMLPFKRQTGKQAFKRLRVYIGVPEELKDAKLEKIESAENKLSENFTLVEDISKSLGAKW